MRAKEKTPVAAGVFLPVVFVWSVVKSKLRSLIITRSKKNPLFSFENSGFFGRSVNKGSVKIP